ncbi:MAG: EAL domain-containing protein [Xanthomonadaceae bacterium]|nr:EAL domain-containing protein [Xanthomonadaceae bacterium]
MKHDNVVKILFAEDSLEDAEQAISVLRNGGIAVRPARASNEAEFEAALESLGPDLVLANPAARDLSLVEVARLIETTGRDIALIALCDSSDEELVVKVFADGARALALRQRPEQLRAIVDREMEALTMRRSVRRLQTALRESERRCDSLLDSSRDPIAYVHEGMHVRANRAYLEMFGFEEFGEIEGLTLLDLVAGDDTEDFKALLKRLSRGEKPPPRLELKAMRADGITFDATMEFAQATFEGEPCLQIVFRRQMAADPTLIEQLQRDAATGLFNRGHMLALLDDAVAQAAGGRNDQALLLVEPDNFRGISDQIGIGNGDAFMRALGARLVGVLGEHDAAGRLGDCTFGVLLRSRPHEAVPVLAQALLRAVAESILDIGARSLAVTISVGGSLLGERNANAAGLLDRCSEALRAAQSEGGNRVGIHDPAAREKAEAEKDRYWLALLKEALANDRFVLYHQQITGLTGGEGELSELLLRLDGPKGVILPSYFLPVAERHGLMPAVDRWVLREAIRLLGEPMRQGQVLMVKLSVQSLEDPALLGWLQSTLVEHEVRGHQLVLEMPESKVVTSLKPAREFVQGVKQIGCRFALEQFGSGLNSFQLLSHVDADFLKIDRNYMADLPRHPENQQRIRAICQQAAALGKQTVAEWVEDVASVSLLYGCGVGYIQGHFQHEPERVLLAETAR